MMNVKVINADAERTAYSTAIGRAAVSAQTQISIAIHAPM